MPSQYCLQLWQALVRCQLWPTFQPMCSIPRSCATICYMLETALWIDQANLSFIGSSFIHQGLFNEVTYNTASRNAASEANIVGTLTKAFRNCRHLYQPLQSNWFHSSLLNIQYWVNVPALYMKTDWSFWWRRKSLELARVRNWESEIILQYPRHNLQWILAMRGTPLQGWIFFCKVLELGF